MLKLDEDFAVPASVDHETLACLRLWAEVFRGGIHAALAEIRRGETPQWLLAARTSPGSFFWLCDLFNMDGELVREKLMAKAGGLK